MSEVFSPTEEKVLKILGSKKLKIADLAEDYFKGEKKPIDPNAVVSGAIYNINRKCKFHKLTWFINGSGLGRGGKTVWKDKQ